MYKDKRALITQGLYPAARYVPSPHFDDRPSDLPVSLLVIHNISLPPGQFGGRYVDDLFLGRLNPEQHPYFAQIYQMRVSAHCLIDRQGQITQYVPFDKRAWHAGVSSFQGQSRCNDYAIGIELEGTDTQVYSAAQYAALTRLSQAIMHSFPAISLGRIVGHCDIAPGRKTDPGFAFDWAFFRQQLS